MACWEHGFVLAKVKNVHQYLHVRAVPAGLSDFHILMTRTGCDHRMIQYSVKKSPPPLPVIRPICSLLTKKFSGCISPGYKPSPHPVFCLLTTEDYTSNRNSLMNNLASRVQIQTVELELPWSGCPVAWLFKKIGKRKKKILPNKTIDLPFFNPEITTFCLLSTSRFCWWGRHIFRFIVLLFYSALTK